MARYLLAVSPLAGHVMPLLRVGADLRDRGHQVRMLTGAQYRDIVGDHRLCPAVLPTEAHPRAPRAPSRDSRLAPASLVQRWKSGRADMCSVFLTPMPAQYRALRRQLHRQYFDAVLCDVAFSGAVPLILTDQPRPPVVACGVGPLTLSSVDTPPFGTGWQPRPGRNYQTMTWVVHRVLFADVQASFNTALRALGAREAPVFLSDWPLLADRLLQFTVPSMEYARRDLPSSVSFTGPVLPSPPPRRGVEVRWAGLPSRYRTVVHVTQGTWNNSDLNQLIRPTIDAFADDDDVLVVATTGRLGRSAIAGPIPRNAYITDYVPYPQLLPHVDVMITNGGYGGVHQALWHGVPLIVAGQNADKPEVAARVAYTGAGINLATARPTAAAIAAAAKRVLSTRRYRAAARRLADEIQDSRALDAIAETLAGLQARAAN
jgi:UDP:flavonoid glycosyltransferase YjiC (YdhE family)